MSRLHSIPNTIEDITDCNRSLAGGENCEAGPKPVQELKEL